MNKQNSNILPLVIVLGVVVVVIVGLIVWLAFSFGNLLGESTKVAQKIEVVVQPERSEELGKIFQPVRQIFGDGFTVAGP